MLEGYLNQSAKNIPDLQEQANALAKEVVDEANNKSNNGSSSKAVAMTQEAESKWRSEAAVKYDVATPSMPDRTKSNGRLDVDTADEETPRSSPKPLVGQP